MALSQIPEHHCRPVCCRKLVGPDMSTETFLGATLPYKDCAELFHKGKRLSGSYSLKTDSNPEYQTHCEGGWTGIVSRNQLTGEPVSNITIDHILWFTQCWFHAGFLQQNLDWVSGWFWWCDQGVLYRTGQDLRVKTRPYYLHPDSRIDLSRNLDFES